MLRQCHSQILQEPVANKKILAAFLIIFSWLFYDTLIKILEGFPVNLVILFFCSFYGFVLFTFSVWRFELKSKFDKKILTVLCVPVLLRILLNLYAINTERDDYNAIVNNHLVDTITAIFLAISIFILIKWKRYIV